MHSTTPAKPAEGENNANPSHCSAFRSGWFIWYTAEFIVVLGLNIFVLIRYWDNLTQFMIICIAFPIGGAFTVSPYLRTLSLCRELDLLRQNALNWDEEQKSTLSMAINLASRTVMTSNYFPVVALLLLVIGYSVGHRM